MMLPRTGGQDEEDSSRDSYNGQLLRDIEEISKALYLHNVPKKALMSLSPVRSKSVGKTCLTDAEPSRNQRTPNNYASQRGKKSLSAWSWKKPLKALAHIRQHRFDICFVLRAHSIEGLPSSFNGSTLAVQWKKDVAVLSTLPSRVSSGIAKFEETLMHRCSVYGDRSGPHKSAKYETELFLIYASAVEAPGLDLGNHWIDLTRLLPLSLDDLKRERSTTEWTTSFKLSGVANDAVLNVSFGYSIIKDDFVNSHENHIAASGSSNSRGVLKQARNVSGQLNHLSVPAGEENSSHQISPYRGFELSRSIELLYQKLDIGNLQRIEAGDMLCENIIENPKPGPDFESAIQMDKCDDAEFCFTEKGMEISNLEENSVQDIDPSTIEVIDVTEILKDKNSSFDDESKLYLYDRLFKESSVSSRQSLPGESESAYSSQVISESLDFESSCATNDFLEPERFQEVKSSYKGMEMTKKSISLDDFTESVASEFLNMLELEDHSYAFSSDTAAPESPREQLLKEFEKEALALADFFSDYDGKTEYESGSPYQEERSADFSLNMTATNFFLDYETESSDHEERSEEFSFTTTNRTSQDNNCNPGRKDQILIRRKAKVLEDLETEALMREWGLEDHTFRNSPHVPSDGFGSPIELPLEEPLFRLPPLADGFGHLVRTKSKGYIRSMSPLLFRNSKNDASLIMHVSAPVVLPAELGFDVIEILQSLASLGMETFSKQVQALMPLEDITGKMLHQVTEDCSARSSMFERLDLNSPTEDKTVWEDRSLHQPGSFQDNEFDRFQSFMLSDYVSLEALAPFAMDRIEFLLLEGLKIQCDISDHEAPSSLGTNPGIDPENVLELVDFSLSFDELLSLDAGIVSGEDRINERNLKILSAHHFNKNSKSSGGKNSFLADKLTVAFMVLLRDPLRNYEPVGIPMLALIQVEKDNISTKPDDFSMNSEECISETPLWKIIQVHLAGVKTESSLDCSWGSKAEQQSGSRWLLASGISKPKKLPFSTSMELILRPNTLATRNSEDLLWSLSSDNNGEEFVETKIGDLASLTRNPNIIFPN